jgi:hypothetical protein
MGRPKPPAHGRIDEVAVRGMTFHPDLYPRVVNDWYTTFILNDLKNRTTPMPPITLAREPDNAYDPDAVAVLWDGQVLGHLPARLAWMLAPVMDAGEVWNVTAVRVWENPDHWDQPAVRLWLQRQVADPVALGPEQPAARPIAEARRWSA